MLSEHPELIEKLRKNDNHFARLFNEHSELNEKITRITNDNVSIINTPDLARLKKEKLKLKEHLVYLVMQAKKLHNKLA